jgi:hypothetical protein
LHRGRFSHEQEHINPEAAINAHVSRKYEALRKRTTNVNHNLTVLISSHHLNGRSGIELEQSGEVHSGKQTEQGICGKLPVYLKGLPCRENADMEQKSRL